jgi:hypothetical protein
MTSQLPYEREDYSAVVKNTGSELRRWKWEIYRAGNAKPIKRSLKNFDSMTTARRAGNEALKQLLDLLFS